MKKTLLSAFLALACVASPIVAEAQQREAFPGAEGYGRLTTGGRGGKVYHVTTLEDNEQPGSFRYACNQSGARTIVFDVSGTIFLKSELKLRNGNVTIAGQTAPGDGICIADFAFGISASNVIIRFMHFRPGNRHVNEGDSDGADGLGALDQKNIIVDHCSVSWSVDECLSFSGCTNTTVQWCLVYQSLKNAGHSKGSHGYGGNWGGSAASYHHNLLAHHDSRTPRLGPRPTTQLDERMDMRNNVIYNFGGNGCYGGEGMNVNIVNNYYKPGAATKSNNNSADYEMRIAGIGIRTVDYCLDKAKTATNFNAVKGTSYTKDNVSGSYYNGNNRVVIGGKAYDINMTDNTIDVDGTKVTVAWNAYAPALHKWGTFYVDGNVNSRYSSVKTNNWTYGIYNQGSGSGNDGLYTEQTKNDMRLDTPIDYLYTTTHSADQAYEKVLAYAGASLSRDALDEIIINDVKKGTYTFGTKGILDTQDDVYYTTKSTTTGTTNPWPELKSTSAKADTDGDGMPDEWESANGLNPNDATDGAKVTADGYTNLEHYINSLVQTVMDAGYEGGKLLSGNLESTDDAVTLPEYDPSYTVEPEPFESGGGQIEINKNKESHFNAGTVLIDNDDMKVTNYFDCEGTSSNYSYKVSLADNEVMTFEGCINIRTNDYPSASNLSGTSPSGQSSLKIEVKRDMKLSAFVRTGNNKSLTMYSHGSDKNVSGTNTYEVDNTDNNRWEFTWELTPGTYTLTEKGGGGRLSGFYYTLIPSGIEEVIIDSANSTDEKIYNLMGVEVKADNLTPGIYIRGGKKYLVR